MPNLEIPLEAGGRLELAYAAIKPGKEDQLFGSYFPKVGPIVAEYGGRPLGSFKLLQAPPDMPEATFGALFFWPSAAAFDQLHQDKRFLELAEIRDDALAFLSNAHFFDISSNLTLIISADTPHVISMSPLSESDNALLALPSAKDSPNKTYAGKNLAISNENSAVTDRGTAKVSFNPPAAA